MKEASRLRGVGRAVGRRNVQHFVVPPDKYEGEEPPLCRIGRMFRDARIFTRDHWDDTMPTSGWW
jgi:hypothetical protein